MSRPLSAETEVKQLRSRFRKLDKALGDTLKREQILRGQLTKAQQTVAEWQARFDKLLSRDEAKP